MTLDGQWSFSFTPDSMRLPPQNRQAQLSSLLDLNALGHGSGGGT